MRTDQIPELLRSAGLEFVGGFLMATGFVVSLVTWLGIRTVNNPAAQFPVIVSGGLVAIGLFLGGAALLTAGLIVRQMSGRMRQDRPAWYRSNGPDSHHRTRADEVDLPAMPEDVRERRVATARRRSGWETASG